ncbi:FHA domain-containing protein [Oleomonas cavernae]|uniref:FHA domain-containing protein n=1 Tax=Oleomonas cavernae TaxID=2320859 RepID=A0A418WE93_9PROT|nr:FHA domain-containing protein [Oleomonas cavernae]
MAVEEFMPLVLTFTGTPPDGLPPRYVVPPSGAAIGRGQANDFVLPDPEQKLSRRHCEVRPERGGWLLFDNSTNGTFLNDQPERLDPRVPVLLQNGDSIILGGYVLVVVIEPDPVAEPDYPMPVEQAAADLNAGRFDDFDRLRNDPGGGAGPVDDPFAAFDIEPPPGGGSAPPSDFRLDSAVSQDPPPSRQSDLYQVGRVDPAADFSAETEDPFAAFDLEAPPPGSGAQADHADHGAVQFKPPPARRDVIPKIGWTSPNRSPRQSPRLSPSPSPPRCRCRAAAATTTASMRWTRRRPCRRRHRCRRWCRRS